MRQFERSLFFFSWFETAHDLYSSKSLELVKKIIMGRYKGVGAFLNTHLKRSDNQYKNYLKSSCKSNDNMDFSAQE